MQIAQIDNSSSLSDVLALITVVVCVAETFKLKPVPRTDSAESEELQKLLSRARPQISRAAQTMPKL